MQNTEASVPVSVALKVIVPGGEPFSVIMTQSPWPKQPALAWRAQKLPKPSAVAVGVSVLSGVRSTLIGPRCAPSQQFPPPTVQGQLQAEGVRQQFPRPGPGPGRAPRHSAVGGPTPPVAQSRV